jgi:dihydroflavonol-4-reductase
VSGVKGPPLSIALPRSLTTLGIGLLEKAAGMVGAKLPITQVEAEMASSFWYCDSRKAERELGFSPRDPNQTLLDTVKDIRGEFRSPRTVTALPKATSTVTIEGSPS